MYIRINIYIRIKNDKRLGYLWEIYSWVNHVRLAMSIQVHPFMAGAGCSFFSSKEEKYPLQTLQQGTSLSLVDMS